MYVVEINMRIHKFIFVNLITSCFYWLNKNTLVIITLTIKLAIVADIIPKLLHNECNSFYIKNILLFL